MKSDDKEFLLQKPLTAQRIGSANLPQILPRTVSTSRVRLGTTKDSRIHNILKGFGTLARVRESIAEKSHVVKREGGKVVKNRNTMRAGQVHSLIAEGCTSLLPAQSTVLK